MNFAQEATLAAGGDRDVVHLLLSGMMAQASDLPIPPKAHQASIIGENVSSHDRAVQPAAHVPHRYQFAEPQSKKHSRNGRPSAGLSLFQTN